MSITILANENQNFSTILTKKIQNKSVFKKIFNSLMSQKKLPNQNFLSANFLNSKPCESPFFELSQNIKLDDVLAKINQNNKHLSINQESVNRKIIGKEIW
jgi:hypothetical protein